MPEKNSETLSPKGVISVRRWVFVLFVLLLVFPIVINLVSNITEAFSNPLSELEVNQSVAIEPLVGTNSAGDIITDLKFFISFPDGHGAIIGLEEIQKLNLDVRELGACDSITRTGPDTYKLKRAKTDSEA